MTSRGAFQFGGRGALFLSGGGMPHRVLMGGLKNNYRMGGEPSHATSTMGNPEQYMSGLAESQ